MADDKHKALYRVWLFDIWQEGRYELYEDLFTDDFVDHDAMPDQPKGRAGDEWAARGVRESFPDLRFSLDVCLADEEFVTGRWTMTGTNTGKLFPFGLPPTGRSVTMHGMEIFRVRDGRLAEVWHQEGLPHMLQQLGLGPPPTPVMHLMARISALRNR